MKKYTLIILSALFFGFLVSCGGGVREMPETIYSGEWDAGHVQGIALDIANGHIYYSFTTMLVKCDFQGNVVGTVTGLLGHLGCLAFNPEDGRLYGSLEYKHDSIGKGILEKAGKDVKLGEGFYVAIFDCSSIVSRDMDAQTSGVMKTVYLSEVYDDYIEGNFGCSGIDGISFGPEFGYGDDPTIYLTVAYGIYGDVNRDDNDDQVLLQYDITDWDDLAQPLTEANLHKSGPSEPVGKYWIHTGNTNWGVQNLEYDPHSLNWFMAVYPGEKEEFENDNYFMVDRTGSFVGFNYPYGSTGLCSLGDGRFYISHPSKGENGQSCTAVLTTFEELTGEE